MPFLLASERAVDANMHLPPEALLDIPIGPIRAYLAKTLVATVGNNLLQ